MPQPSLVIALVAYSIGMSIGQIFFKLAATRGGGGGGGDASFAASVTSGYFLIAILLYGGLTLFWVWILARVPLATAYPFVAMSFVFTPLLSLFIFSERIPTQQWLGIALIVCGLGVISGSAR